MHSLAEWLWIRLTWWRWQRCWACGRRVWGAHWVGRRGGWHLLCDHADCPAAPEWEDDHVE